MKPGLYNLVRTTDQTGVSGTGRVAQVAVFADGSAATRWMTGKDSFATWASAEDMLDIHVKCHPDTTKLVPVAVTVPCEHHYDDDCTVCDPYETGRICEHGIIVTQEYCDDCATAAVAAHEAKTESHRRAPTEVHKRHDGGPATVYPGPANITVLCLTCTMTFTTSTDSYQDDKSRCPACDGTSLTEKPKQSTDQIG